MIEVDGGVNASNAREVMEAGCDIAVMGSAIFGGDILENYRKVQKVL